jgi:hypothetical protein
MKSVNETGRGAKGEFTDKAIDLLPSKHGTGTKAMSRQLSATERGRFHDLEERFQKGWKTVSETAVELGLMLAEIRDRCLFREAFKTFDEYCETRWDLRKSQAHRLIGAAHLYRDFKAMGFTTLPYVERQSRKLLSLPVKDRPEVWKRAVEFALKANGGSEPIPAKLLGVALTQFVPQSAAGKKRIRNAKALRILDRLESALLARLPEDQKNLLDKLRQSLGGRRISIGC